MSFLQPCLLTLLQRGEDHGYNLLSGLEEFGFNQDNLDPSLIYRALKEMEVDGLGSSQWGEESLGPRRRIYGITEDGHQALDVWIEDLSRTRDEIEKLLAARDKGQSEEKTEE